MKIFLLILTKYSKQLLEILNLSRSLNFRKVLPVFLYFFYLHRIFFRLPMISIFITLTFWSQYFPLVHLSSKNNCLWLTNSFFHFSFHRTKVLFFPSNSSYPLFIFRTMKPTFLLEFLMFEFDCVPCLFIHRHYLLFQ